MRYGTTALVVGATLLCWDHIVAFAATVFWAVMPLLVGAAIAYVVNLPLSLLEAHLAPRSRSRALSTLRRPLALLLTFLLIAAAFVLAASLLFPAVMESVRVIHDEGLRALEGLSRLPLLEPVFHAAHGMLSSDLWKGLATSRLSDFVRQNAGSVMGVLGDQLVTVIMSFTTLFFGIVFSLALLADLSRVRRQVTRALRAYLGARRYGRLVDILSVFDRSFRNYIVRQCTEAAIMGVTAAVVLLVCGFPYAVGVASLVGFASLVPIVGFPVAAWAGAFLVFTERPLLAVVFLLVLFLVQGLEANLVLPRVGDPRTVLTGAWPIVAVTIGGGVGGFLGMLVGNPIGSAVYQLVRGDVTRREAGADDRSPLPPRAAE